MTDLLNGGDVPNNISVPLTFSSGWRFGGIVKYCKGKIVIALLKGALIDWFRSVERLLVRGEGRETMVDR